MKKDEQAVQEDDAALQRRTVALCAVVIIIVGLVAYWNSFDGVFVFDDMQSVRDNEHIRKLWPPSEPLSLALWDADTTIVGRPVLSLSFAINHALFGPEPWGYHLGNLAIHVAGALLLFGIIRRTLRLPYFSEPVRAGAARFALVAAVLWMIHPLQTESVTYIVQRAESLMGLFYLFTFYCMVRIFEGERRWRWRIAAVVACALGMGTKEVMASVPVVVLLYDYVFISGSLKSALRQRWGLYLALGATWAILAGLLLSTLYNVMAVPESMGLLEYPLTQPGVILYYLRLVVWPWPLVIAYGWPFARDAASIVLPGIVIVGLVAAAAWGVWRRKWWGFLGAWFFLILAPTSSFYALLQNLFEHRMYLSLAAPVVLAVVAGQRLLRGIANASSPSAGRVRAVGALCLVLAVAGTFVYLTQRRNRDYHSTQRLVRATVADRPQSYAAHHYLAIILLERGMIMQATKSLERALKLNPGYIPARTDLAKVLCTLGKPKQAIEHCRAALAISDRHAGAHGIWGNALLLLNRPVEAIAHYKQALELAPRFVDAHYNLAAVLARDGKTDEAIKHYEQTVKLRPSHAEALATLGRLLQQRGNSKRAIVHLERAVALRPADTDLRLLLSEALADQGELARAVPQLEKVVALVPGDLVAANNLAWLLATCPADGVRNGKRAVAHARRVCSATGNRNPAFLDTLAAAYAEAGDFDKAVEIAGRAAELVPQDQPAMAAAIRERLALYKARKAYRDRP